MEMVHDLFSGRGSTTNAALVLTVAIPKAASPSRRNPLCLACSGDLSADLVLGYWVDPNKLGAHRLGMWHFLGKVTAEVCVSAEGELGAMAEEVDHGSLLPRPVATGSLGGHSIGDGPLGKMVQPNGETKVGIVHVLVRMLCPDGALLVEFRLVSSTLERKVLDRNRDLG